MKNTHGKILYSHQGSVLRAAEDNESSDPAIDTLVDEIVAKEKESYVEQAIPFEAKEGQFRKKLLESLYRYKEKYLNGYQVLLETLAKMHPRTNEKDDAIAPFIIDDQILANVNDVEIDRQIQEETPLSEIFGLSENCLQELYKATMYLMQQNEMAKAQDALYFLVTIAPNYPLFWSALGFCSGQCHDHDNAVKACNASVELDPNNAEAYVIYAQIFISFNEVSNAHSILDRGLDHAKKNENEVWAQNFKEILQSEKQYIAAHNRK